MKNIWWINHHAIPPVVPGGTRHYSLSKEIMKLGDYKVTIINGSFDHLTSHFEEGASWGASLHAPIIRNYAGVDFYSLPTPSYCGNASLGRLNNMWIFYRNALKYLNPHINVAIGKPDIIIGSTVHPLAAYAGYKLSKLYEVPFVYEVRDLWPLSIIESGKIGRNNPVALFLEHIDKIMAQQASMIITTAPLMCDYYIKRYAMPSEKFIWVTNGSSLVYNKPEPHYINKKSTMSIGYAGALGYANGLVDFLVTLSKVPPRISERFTFTFIGDGTMKEELQRCIKQCCLTNVSIKNSVPKNDMWSILSKFDMLLFCLLENSIFRYGISPNKLADYHAVGRPIIEIVSASSTPVLMAKSGYHIDHVSALSHLLSQILRDDESTYRAMANNARKFAEENYNWKQLAYKLNHALINIKES